MLQVTFVEHDLPDASLTAISPSKIFYHSDNHIYSYELSTRSHRKLFDTPKPSSLISLINSYLFFVCGNKAKLFNYVNLCAETVDITLKEVPQRVVEHEGNLAFIYSNSIELLFIKKDSTTSIVSIDLEVLDICCTKEHSYLLTKSGTIYRTINIFVTKALMALSEVNVAHSTSDKATRLFAEDKSIFIMREKTSTGKVELTCSGANTIYALDKYEVSGKCLILDYSLQVEGMATVSNGFLLGKSFVQLSKAPFFVAKDRLFSFNGSIGVSSGRIYFLKDNVVPHKNELSYEMKNFSATVNPNLVKIPEFVKDPKQREQFLKNEVTVQKYEILMKKIKELDVDMNNRERELVVIDQDLRNRMETLENKKLDLIKTVNNLRKRAEAVGFKGRSEGFYSKINQLEQILNNLPDLKVLEYKNKLKAQKAALLSKFK